MSERILSAPAALAEALHEEMARDETSYNIYKEPLSWNSTS